MRSLTSMLTVFVLNFLPLADSMPKHTPRLFYNVGRQLSNQTYFGDLSQFNFAPFNVTEINILCNRPNMTVDYSCNLTFEWFDPNSVRQNRLTSGSCQTSWSWDGVTKHNASADGSNPMSAYRVCSSDGRTHFGVSVPSFWHPGNFSLELSHHYRDDENFTIPWEYPTTFAEANITLCEEGELENTVYHYNPGPINGTVFGLVD